MDKKLFNILILPKAKRTPYEGYAQILGQNSHASKIYIFQNKFFSVVARCFYIYQSIHPQSNCKILFC